MKYTIVFAERREDGASQVDALFTDGEGLVQVVEQFYEEAPPGSVILFIFMGHQVPLNFPEPRPATTH